MNFIGSPNFTGGRQGVAIDRIVIHWMDGHLADADRVFQDATRQTSSHFGVEDTTVHQYVKLSDTAYHAGDWAMNLRSIGIEHSAQPGRDASEDTYKTSAALIRLLCKQYGLPLDREHIIKHSEVVADQCPGTIDIDKLIDLAKVEGMTIQNRTEGQALYFLVYGRGSSDQEADGLIGKNLDTILKMWLPSQEWLHDNDLRTFGDQRLSQIQALSDQVKALTAELQKASQATATTTVPVAPATMVTKGYGSQPYGTPPPIDPTVSENEGPVNVKVIPPDPNKWMQTYKQYTDGQGVPIPMIFTAVGNHVIDDVSDPKLPEGTLQDGMTVEVAGEFEKDGIGYYRTTASEDNHTWYGIDKSFLTHDNALDRLSNETIAMSNKQKVIAKTGFFLGILNWLFKKRQA